MRNVSYLDLVGAKCLGRPELFDSTRWTDHVQARAICATCPVIEACRRRLAFAQDQALRSVDGPTGTWAGKLYGAHGRPRKETA